MIEPAKCPVAIAQIYSDWESERKEAVEEARVYLISVQEIIGGKYLKVLRNRNKSLAPGKIRNDSPEDIAAGQMKYDTILSSIDRDGFDYRRPVSFLIRKSNEKRKLHQGHHRIAIASELKLLYVPVVFIFDRDH